MEDLLGIFSDVSKLEPHCPGCDTKIILGVTTKYGIKYRCPVCLKCGQKL